MVTHFVYILQCGDGTLYTGYAKDPQKRLEEHRDGKKGAKYTRGRGPFELVWQEGYPVREEAMAREYKIKQMSREEKLALIEGRHGAKGNGVKGRLYLCATPIGNLEDITLRVLRVLKEVDVIAAEDTRHTRKLLTYFDIHTPLTSYHQHNEASKSSYLVEELLGGRQVALVSDAGMPGISDPGYYLIRAALNAGVEVVPLPGPSAAVTALVISGLSTERFAFEGFLPVKKKERQQRLSRLIGEERTMIFYEAPHRIKACLADMAEVWGDRQAAVVRELTKIHEAAVRGPLGQVLAHFQANSPRGEFVIVVEGAEEGLQNQQEEWEEPVEEHLRKVIASGLTKKEAIKEVASQRGLSKREVYKLAVDLSNLSLEI